MQGDDDMANGDLGLGLGLKPGGMHIHPVSVSKEMHHNNLQRMQSSIAGHQDHARGNVNTTTGYVAQFVQSR